MGGPHFAGHPLLLQGSSSKDLNVRSGGWEVPQTEDRIKIGSSVRKHFETTVIRIQNENMGVVLIRDPGSL